MSRKPLLIFALLFTASLVAIGLLGRSVVSDLRVLSVAQHDDVSWRMSQLEVELLRFQGVTREAMLSEQSSLSDVRKRFDLFYSRITTLRQSSFFQTLQGDSAAVADLEAAVDFLDRTIPFIDGSEADLRRALPEIFEQAQSLQSTVRDLALAGVESFTSQEAEGRATLSATLQRLALALAGFILVLGAVVAALILLYRQIHASTQVSEIARARFEAAVSSSLDAVLVIDTHGRIVEFNGAAEAVFGYSREEAIGGDMAELIVPEHLRKAHLAGLRRFLETGKKKVIDAGRLRLEGVRKSGEVFPVELSITLADARGERVFVSFLRDITPELNAELELKVALEKAQESDKAKSKLLTVMSHEMRTPLNGILGSLDLIDQRDLDQQQKSHLNAIALSGELLLSHVKDVLDLSKPIEHESPSLAETFELQNLVSSVVDGQRGHAAARGNEIEVGFLQEVGLASVEGNSKALRRCLINLIGNAIKFTKNGAISIEVERPFGDDVVEFRVSDTGIGIGEEDLERIFEEFVTVDSSYDRSAAGTGLGLAITRQLVEAEGGTIEADSILGEGSMFIVRLPLPEGSEESSIASDASLESETFFEPFKALVVDDNQINREILSAIVTDLGAHVYDAASGLEAIDLAARIDFDVLLLDISMPEIDGLETLSRIRGCDGPSKEATAFAVTAHAAVQDHETILESGFQDLIIKPLNRAIVSTKLAKVLETTNSRQKPPSAAADLPEYLLRFGPEKFQSALKQTCSEIENYCDTLEDRGVLESELREEAHRLSGSAAVLGQTSLWETLQAVQNASETEWQANRDGYVPTIRALVADAKRSTISESKLREQNPD